VLLGIWYRPGVAEVDDFSALYEELSNYFSQVSGVLLLDDMSIHHKRWLRFSSGDSPAGAQLRALCDCRGLSQLVREPTRNDFLLDLVLTDVADTSVRVLPAIADHKAVRVNIPMTAIIETEVTSRVWQLKSANWAGLQQELEGFDWAMLEDGDAEQCANLFWEVLWICLVKHIPQKVVRCKRSSHPWLNSRCHEAIIRKNIAEGSDYESYKSAQASCDEVLRQEHAKYVEALKAKLSALPRCSKQWWRINRELLRRKSNIASIPPLRDGTNWILDAKAKADTFAETFASESKLAPELVDTSFSARQMLRCVNFCRFVPGVPDVCSRIWTHQKQLVLIKSPRLS